MYDHILYHCNQGDVIQMFYNLQGKWIGGEAFQKLKTMSYKNWELKRDQRLAEAP